MSGATLDRNWTHSSISKKFAGFFALLLVIVLFSVLIVERSLDSLKGAGTQIDLAGSLRYLTRNMQINAQHYAALGTRADLAETEDNLIRFRRHLGLLIGGGDHQGRDIPHVPQEFRDALERIESSFDAYEKTLREVIAASDRRLAYEERGEFLHAQASNVLQAADRLTNALAEKLDARQMDIRITLLGLVLTDGLVLILGLLAIRARIVRPLRSLAVASQRIAQGHYSERLDFASRDEIGQLAVSVNQMALSIESRESELLRSRSSLLRANRALRLLSSVNHATISAKDEQSLFDVMCQLAVSEGGYHSVLLGRAEHDEARSVTVVASEGVSNEYRANLNITWDDNERGQGVAGTVIRESRTSVVRNLAHNPRFAPWRKAAIEQGIEDAIGLPVRVDGQVWGVVCLYSTQPDAFDESETQLLQEMADDLGFGIETLRVRQNQLALEKALRESNEHLEKRVQERTLALEEANRELEAFSYSVSHDLRAPLRSIDGFAKLLGQEYGAALDAVGQDYLARIGKAARRMAALIDDLLELARITRAEMAVCDVNMSELATDIASELSSAEPHRQVSLDISPNLFVKGDPALLRVLLQNLLENAWKYTGKSTSPGIRFGLADQPSGERAFFVSDNGVGFDMTHAARLFLPFTRLHRAEDFPGTGVGLATAFRIVSRHGGRIWAHAEEGKGATFYFTLS